MKLMNEIRERVEQLRKIGISEMVLNSLVMPTNKLSRLTITKDYHIFLPDYNNLEIKMTPLPKAVFILFLNHEDGILFKNLSNCKTELTQIYTKITKRSSIASVKKSIDDICDPTNNSLNEKCARVREAFLQHFDERLAMNYFITGERGEVKRIVLSRYLVEWK